MKDKIEEAIYHIDIAKNLLRGKKVNRIRSILADLSEELEDKLHERIMEER